MYSEKDNKSTNIHNLYCHVIYLNRLKSIPYFLKSLLLSIIFFSFFLSCDATDAQPIYESESGCDGQPYPETSSSQYVLPYEVGLIVRTGLTNCSDSFHGAGEPDQYAFDFNMPEGTSFSAAREGIVIKIVESASSDGGGTGNYVLIDHGDDTFGYYLHSPENGIYVNVGDTVTQGQELGITGRSGLAGYPHLHFIVVKGNYNYPYSGVALSFKNVNPKDRVLRSYTLYQAMPY